MTDSTLVFTPGQRVTAPDGTLASGATVYFYDAGTTDPKTVYSDRDLTASLSLGTSIVTDSAGYPTSDGSTLTLIYTGTAPYKIRCETEDGELLFEHDWIKGAVETVDISGVAVNFERPIEVKSLDFTVDADADVSKVFALNTTGGAVVATLPSAVAFEGNFVTFTHAGTVNTGRIVTTGSQAITDGATNHGESYVLRRSGEEVTLLSDGANWRVINRAGGVPLSSAPFLVVTDRLSAPPGSPAVGAYYILTASPSGSWSSFSEHDVAYWTGAAWIRFLPAEGWCAWVADEDVTYTHSGSSWVSPVATTTKAGVVELATSAEVIAETADRVLTADVLRFHPGVPKASGYITYSGGTPTLESGALNVTGITDVAQGRVLITLDNDFADELYRAYFGFVTDNNVRSAYISNATQLVGSFEITMVDAGGSNRDPAAIWFEVYGTLA